MSEEAGEVKGEGEAGPSARTEATSLRLSIGFGLCYFLFYAIYGVTSPYMPVILRDIGYTPAAIGVLLAFYELVGIGGPIVLARKADQSGRPKPFLWGSAIAVVIGLALLVGLPLPLMTACSLVLISLGLKTPIPLIDATILRTIESKTAKGERLPKYGTFRALGSAGFVLVTLSLQLVPGFDGFPAWAMAGCAAALAFFYLLSVLPLPEIGVRIPRRRNGSPSFGWIDREFLVGLAIIVLGRLAMSAVNSFFSLYLMEDLSWHAIGAMNALAASAEIPMMMLAWRLMRRRSPMGLVAISSTAVVVRLLIYALVPTKAGVIGAQLLHSLCYGVFQPASVAFVNLKTPPAHRTTGMALLLGFGIGLPLVLGSALGGFVVEAWGYRWLFASFSVFGLASLSLYARNRAVLDRIR